MRLDPFCRTWWGGGSCLALKHCATCLCQVHAEEPFHQEVQKGFQVDVRGSAAQAGAALLSFLEELGCSGKVFGNVAEMNPDTHFSFPPIFTILSVGNPVSDWISNEAILQGARMAGGIPNPSFLPVVYCLN